MNHEEAARLLGPYLDGELDLNTSVKLEEHLAECPACQEALTREQELVDLVRSEAPKYQAPAFLKSRIRAALPREEAAAPSEPWWNRFTTAWTLPGLAGAAIVILALAILFIPAHRNPELAREAVANHVRSLQVNHLMDVASTDQHTVKPWFAGKLDYSPQVVDLGPSGYPLVGGRLDVLGGRNVAAIVYQRRKHYINLFVWPADLESLHGEQYDENGYHALAWHQSGMNYLAVSELGEKELKEFVEMIKDQTLDSKPGE